MHCVDVLALLRVLLCVLQWVAVGVVTALDRHITDIIRFVFIATNNNVTNSAPSLLHHPPLHNQPPNAQARGVLELVEEIMQSPLVLPPTPPVSPELADLLQAMMAKDPTARCSLKDVMHHPWVTMGGETTLLCLEVRACHVVGKRQNQYPVDGCLLLLLLCTCVAAPSALFVATWLLIWACRLRTLPSGVVLLSRCLTRCHGDPPQEASVVAPRASVTDAERQTAVKHAGITEWMMPVLDRATYAAGEWLVRQGDELSQVFYIEAGEVELVREASHTLDDLDTVVRGWC